MVEPVLQVAVPAPVRRRFDYLPPRPGWTPPVRPGVRVQVPFGRTTVIGVVVGVAPTSAVDAARLKRVRAVIDAEPLLDPAMLKLLVWAGGYFQHPIGEVVTGTLPRLLRLGHAPETGRSVRYAATAAGTRAFAEGIARAPVQARLLGLMLAAGSVPETALAAEHRDWRRPLRALVAKGLAEVREDPPRAGGGSGMAGRPILARPSAPMHPAPIGAAGGGGLDTTGFDTADAAAAGGARSSSRCGRPSGRSAPSCSKA